MALLAGVHTVALFSVGNVRVFQLMSVRIAFVVMHAEEQFYVVPLNMAKQSSHFTTRIRNPACSDRAYNGEAHCAANKDDFKRESLNSLPFGNAFCWDIASIWLQWFSWRDLRKDSETSGVGENNAICVRLTQFQKGKRKTVGRYQKLDLPWQRVNWSVNSRTITITKMCFCKCILAFREKTSTVITVILMAHLCQAESMLSLVWKMKIA